jgi:copper transport protein
VASPDRATFCGVRPQKVARSAAPRRLGALIGLLAALLGVAFVLAGAASAHATLVSSDPIDGSRLKAVPGVVTMTFDEQVGLGSLGYLHVVDQSGKRVDVGAAYHPGGDGTKIAANLKSGLGDGTYTESYRVISADSHPVAGTVRFVVGNGVLSATVVSTATVNATLSIVFDVARWVSFAGFAVLGSLWLLLTVWREGRDDLRARRIVWFGWGLTVVGAVAEVLVQGPYAAGEGISAVPKWTLLDATLHTDYGQYLCGRLVLLGVLGLVLGAMLQPGEEWRTRLEHASWPLVVALAFTFSAVGHPNTTNPRWVSVPADMLHLLAMAAWVGGLVLLVGAVLPRHEPDELRVVLPVFSPVAFVAVVVLAITGLYEAWRGIGTIHAIFSTTYGLLVVTKVVLFVGLIALGNLSRVAIQRRLGETSERSERVRRAVLVEIVLAIGVLVATSVLVAEPRGKEAIGIREARPRAASAALGGGRTITVTVDPGKHGTITASVALSPGVEPQSVTGTAALPSQELGPIPLGLAANGTDLYGASGLVLPAAGNWVFTLIVSTSEFDATTTQVTIHLY